VYYTLNSSILNVFFYLILTHLNNVPFYCVLRLTLLIASQSPAVPPEFGRFLPLSDMLYRNRNAGTEEKIFGQADDRLEHAGVN
jgi:hypothetical protein